MGRKKLTFGCFFKGVLERTLSHHVEKCPLRLTWNVQYEHLYLNAVKVPFVKKQDIFFKVLSFCWLEFLTSDMKGNNKELSRTIRKRTNSPNRRC
jgi:hypothetical protein